MSKNYAKTLPMDSGMNPIQGLPAPVLAVRRLTSENASTSSVITLNDNTTQIEVSAMGTAAVIKWIPTTDTQASVISASGTANFDHVIPPNTMRSFVVPMERAGISSIAGANIMNGLYQRVAWKSVGVGSIMGSEF